MIGLANCGSGQTMCAMSEETDNPGATSSASFNRHGLKLQVSCAPQQAEYVAGAPIEVEVTVSNRSSHPAFYVIGDAGPRVAYMEFSATLLPIGQKLRDPFPGTPLEPGGMTSSIQVAPGQSHVRSVLLNQYVALEDVRTMIAPGRSARLSVAWRCYMVVTRSFPEPLPDAVPLSGSFHTGLTRDDAALRQIVESLAGRLTNDWNLSSSDPVGRRQSLAALTSLRIPETIPYLKALLEHPDAEVRYGAEQALHELQHDAKQ